MTPSLENLALDVAGALAHRGLRLATAESCTGGWVAQALTAIAGSSAWFDRGFVTYSNEAKQDMLALPAETLRDYGAVSEETAGEMAVGALIHSQADVSLAITGIAGPSGGSPGKPVGTVCFAWCRYGSPPRIAREHFTGDREAVRRQAVVRALAGLLDVLADDAGPGALAISVP